MDHPLNPQPVSTRHGAVGLFLLLLGASLFFFRGTLETSDEQLMALTTRSIAERFSLVFEEEVYGQRFTGYGVGTPIAGLPVFLVEKLLRASGVMADANFTLFPLTNAILFALTGAMLGGLLQGQRRWGGLAVALLASPLLPASLTYYSELLATLGLAGLVVSLWRGLEDGDSPTPATPPHVIATTLFVLVALLSRVAMTPLILITLLWGWRLGVRRHQLVLGLAGVAAGIVVTLSQNWLLRGSPWVSGYAGQDFTTPFLTGLYGLLVSPERGMILFYPLLLLPFLAWNHLRGRVRSVLILATSLTIFWVTMHALFWTWHGGWTSGPRFLLPCLALFAVPVAAVLADWRRLELPVRIVFLIALGWCLLLNYIYMRHSAFAWWNRLYVFHHQENQWLFLPQLSLWQAWFNGIPLPDASAGLPRLFRLALITLAICAVAFSLFPILSPFRESRTAVAVQGTGSTAGNAALLVIGALFVILGWYLLTGPRGWRRLDTGEVVNTSRSHLLLEHESGTWEGWIDNPLATPMMFHVKANALYRVVIDEQVVLEQTEPIGHHLREFESALTPGRFHQIRVEVREKPGDAETLFEMYWSWGGNGRYLAPVGGEYLRPRPLTQSERMFSWLWRRKFILIAGVLAFLLLLKGLPARNPAEKAV